MNYEYSISCKKCGYKFVDGNMPDQVNMLNEDVLTKAQHNPGCPVRIYENRIKTQVLSSIEMTGTTIITHYSLQYPAR